MADTTDTDQQPPPTATPQNAATLQEQIARLQQLLQPQPIQAPPRAPADTTPPANWVQAIGRGLSRNLPYPVDAQEEEAMGRASLLGIGGGFAGMAAPAQAEAAQQTGLLQLQREQQNQQIEAMKASTPLMNLQLQLQQLQQWQRLYGPQATTPPAGGFPGAVKGAESGGNASARNPLSSAAGPAQFITSTWGDFLKSPQGAGFTEADRVAPPNADAATVARVQAANTAAVNWYAGVNNQAFQDKLGRQATPAELASGHLLGPGYAVKLAQADPNTAVKDVLPANFISNNPNVFTPNMTVANARQSIGGFYGVGGAAGVVPAIAPAPGRVQLAGPPSAVTQPPAAQLTPPAAITAPPAQPAPQPGTQQPTETAPAPAATTGPATTQPVTPFRMTPDTSRAEWNAAHPVDPDLATTFTPTPEQTKNLQTNIDTALEQRNTTATQLKAAIENRDRLTRLAGMGPTIGGAANPAVAQLDGANRSVAQLTEASNVAAKAYSDAVAAQNEIIQTGIANRQKNEEQRQTQFAQDQKIAADVEAARRASGYTAVQHQVDAEQTAGSGQLTRMAEVATKAEAIQPMLTGLIQLINNPKAPEGALGQFLASHQEWLPALKDMGIVDPTKATISQLMKGLTDFMSLDLKPQATGAMRVQEIPMLQGLMPNMATDKATQQQALARVLNYTQRVKDEYDFATEHFGDNVIGPDGKPIEMAPGVLRPNYKIMYKNIDAPMQLDENGRRVGGGLGAPVPTPPPMPSNPANASPGQIEQARRYMKYTQNLPSGMPYNTWERDPQTGQYTLKMYIRP